MKPSNSVPDGQQILKQVDEDLVGERVRQINKELERTGVALDTVLSRYHIGSIEEMSETMFEDAMKGLKRSKRKVA